MFISKGLIRARLGGSIVPLVRRSSVRSLGCDNDKDNARNTGAMTFHRSSHPRIVA